MSVILTAYAGNVDIVNQLVPWVVERSHSVTALGVDLSIEGLRSRKYSIGIFAFLIASLVIFSVIIYIYLPKGEKKLKRGEKIMFGAIILGMVCAVIVGWLQLVEGFLL